MNIPSLIALVVAIEIALHYFRWRETLQGRDLPRPIAYALGVAGMMVPFTFWLLENSLVDAARVLWLVIVAAGLAVVLSYGIDWVVELIWNVREARQREKEVLSGLKEAIDGESKPASN